MPATSENVGGSVATESRSLPWVLIGWFVLLLLACYFPVLKRLVNDWYIDEDMGHGFFVPFVAAYVVWQQRDDILARRYSPNYLGLILVVLGGIVLVAATLGVELTLMRGAFLISLAGVIFTLGGVPLIRQLLFPLALLLFMIPLPALIYNQITFPLQIFASQMAETILSLIGIPVLRDGNVLELPSQKLNVVEACSGIRSLMSLTFLALVYGYFFEPRISVRWILLALTPPIAIFVNAMRVTLTGVFSEYNPELAKGLFHSLEGWVMFMLALGLLLAAHQLLRLLMNRKQAAKQ